ncbi:Ig-like domain-containing protein [uncultured Sphaerotilus sp.]|uniref:Ig-like domain-containing protein n=1 Tax=uncultured Sphaerotilus sp. TaxID=474984 RepID=UPI0030CA13D1
MTMNKMIWRVGGLALAAALSACGGGGADAGCSVFSASCTTTTGTTTTGGTTTSDSGTVSTSSSGTVVLSLSSTTVSASTPGTVTALVKDANGKPIKGAVVAFEVSNGTATLSPERSITDDLGNASATLQPIAGKIGADYVKASADVSSSSTLTTRIAFTVSTVNVVLSNMVATPASVAAYGASVLSVDVEGASSSAPVTVAFSSTCAAAGKADLSPASVSVTGTTARITYRDKGCGTTDRISAQITGTSQQRQIDLVAAAPSMTSLEYVSSTPDIICLAGSGCPMSTQVKFRLRDQYGNAIPNMPVSFSLDIPGVADLGVTSQPTDADGVATVSVTARTTPSPVRVKAKADGTTLATVSNELAIHAGLPTSRTFSFAPEAYNPNGMYRDGTSTAIRVQLNDRFGNVVADGTSISFVSEGASVIPSRCKTASGVCTVNFVSSEFRPANGRVTVLAFAQGEEAFDDTDGNNLYTLGERFNDLGPIFIDKNENDAEDMADGEHIKGEAADGKWSDNGYVRFSSVFTLSSHRLPRISAVPAGGVATCPEGASHQDFLGADRLILSPTTSICRVSRLICIRDSNTAADRVTSGTRWDGNPIPAVSTVTISSKAKGASVKVDNTPIPSTISPTMHRITVELDDCTKALESSGAVDLTVKMPEGSTYTFDIGRIQ